MLINSKEELIVIYRRLVVNTHSGQRLEIKGSLTSINLMEEKLKQLSEIKEIFQVRCSPKDIIYPPAGYKPQYRLHRYFCPYCGAERRFLNIFEGDYLNCQVCRISDRDFAVKSINKLEPIGKKDFRERKKEKRIGRREKLEKIQRIKEGKE